MLLINNKYNQFL